MKLPNASRLIVERGKILEYLLNPLHRYGATKETFFTAFGFRADTWEILAKALCEHGRTHGYRSSARNQFWFALYCRRRIEHGWRSASSCAHGLAIR
jgi:hypothetical protein